MKNKTILQQAHQAETGNDYLPPRRITENDLDESTLGPTMGMGMGMGPPAGSINQQVDSTYSVLGGTLLNRHEWKQHVYLAEFLRYLGDVGYDDLKAAIDGVELNATRQSSPTPSIVTEGQQMNSFDDGLMVSNTHNEITALHEFEAANNNERTARILAESGDYVPLFENLCYFDGHSHPKTYQLVQTMVLLGFTLAMYYKEFYQRKRPSVVDPSLYPSIKVPTFWAFPSGHSTQVHLIKKALTACMPDVSGALHSKIEELADEIAINREFAGVHYYSDTLAGKALAETIWTKFDDMLKIITRPNWAIKGNLIVDTQEEWASAATST